MAANDFPGVRLIRNAANLGFGRANNQGIALAQGRYILLLNSDTVLPPGALVRLLDFMETHPQAAACSPRLLLPDGRAQPYAFGSDPSLGYLLRRGVNRLVFKRALHNWATAVSQPVDWVSGACLLLRRNALQHVGGFDETLFMYFEDVDLCLRLRQAGWQVWYHPQVGITHLGGQSLKQNPAAPATYQESLRYFYRNLYSRPAQWLCAQPFGHTTLSAHARRCLTLSRRPHCCAAFPGIGRYVTNLLRTLPSLLTPEERLTVLHDPAHPLADLQAARFLASTASPFALTQQWTIARQLAHLRADLYHSPYYLMPYRPGVPTVLTVYDLIPLLYPEYSTARARLLFRGAAALALRAANQILAISEATRRDFLAHFPLPSHRITAIPLAPDPIFQPQPAPIVAAVRQRLPCLTATSSTSVPTNPTRTCRC